MPRLFIPAPARGVALLRLRAIPIPGPEPVRPGGPGDHRRDRGDPPVVAMREGRRGGPTMTRPKVRIGTLMLLVVVVALAVALVIQGRELAESRRRVAAMEANDARIRV